MSQTAYLHSYLSIPCSLVCDPHPLRPLRARLAALDDARKTAEQELRALQHRAEHLAQLERDRDSLLESYAGLVPEAIDAWDRKNATKRIE